MKSDKEIQDIYTYFYYNTLPQLNTTYDLEKMALKNINMFNKKNIHIRILELYF